MRELMVALVRSLIENGVNAPADAISFVEYNGRFTGDVSTIILDFSEHDKKVAEEKDAQIRELKRQIEDLEAIIADGKKPDISVSENGVSVGCECGGYHLAKERIKKLEKENAELDRMRKSWMETAEKLSKLNKDLQDRIDSFEFAINQTAELEDRHQSDCIRINQLLTTIDVLTERYQKLREVHGL